MINLAKLRTGLALVTLLGAFHLNAAAASETTKKMGCYDEVYNEGWWTCELGTGGNWDYGYVYYIEWGDGSCSVTGVECYSY
jgi:hypothetical protein